MAVTAPAEPAATPALAGRRLSAAAVVFIVWSATTPLTVIALVVTTGFATTGLIGLPLGFLVVGAVLMLFAPGFVAMARQIGNAGGFYTYISRSLGRPFGVAASWIALLCYNALQIALYGGIGAAAAPVLAWFGISAPWWLIAGCALALVAAFGIMRIDINGRVLAVLLAAEVLLIVVYSAANLANPADGHVTLDALAPSNLFVAGGGAVLAIGVLGSVGFEAAANYIEESRDPQRTVPRATYLSVGLIALLYAFASWALTVAVGSDRIVATAADTGPAMLFNLADANLGGAAVTIGLALFVTSILAAMISFHNTVARYLFALGRERVLPAVLARTARGGKHRAPGTVGLRSGAPWVASAAQSTLAAGVVVAYAIGGWDPTVNLFYWFGTFGGVGILLLLLTTSLGILAYFRRDASASWWSHRIAPALAAVALTAMTTYVFANLPGLFGVAPDHPLVAIVPAILACAAAGGAGYAMYLKTSRPVIYAGIGTGQAQPAAPVTV